MKKLALFISTMVLVSISTSAFAMEVQSTSAERVDTQKMEMQKPMMNEEDTEATADMTAEEKKEYMKEKMADRKEEMYMMKEEAKWDVKENRTEAKENRKEFRMENKDEFEEIKSELSDEEKDALAELKESFKAASDSLREEMKTASSDDEKEEIRESMKELVDLYHEDVKEILADNTAALSLLEERKEIYEENEDLREENREIREDYRSDRKEYIKKYKKSFVKRLGNALDSIPMEKLEEISERIDTFIEKYESNDAISDTKKNAVLDQLAALKEIIEERLEWDDLEEDVVEMVEDLLAE